MPVDLSTLSKEICLVIGILNVSGHLFAPNWKNPVNRAKLSYGNCGHRSRCGGFGSF